MLSGGGGFESVERQIRNRNLLMHCDNFSTVEVVNRGKARNPFTQACLREILWITARSNAWVKMVFVPGVTNRFADLLSRWDVDPKFEEIFMQETEGIRKKECKLTPEVFKFSHKW